LAHTEKMAAVGTLAAGVAHEVNNPLAGVTACLENLRAHPEDADMRTRYLDLIGDGLRRIERTVTNLLDFSRPREIRPESTSINHNLRHVVELVGYQLRRADIQVVFDLDDDQALVMADHFQMEQLFLNLVLNAIDAMPEGGTLTLRTRVAGGEVVAEVLDTGTGISEEIRDRLFDPFFTTRDVGEGTGLGLAVSDSIVAAHGGSIEVESNPGSGSTFRVRFAHSGDLKSVGGAV
jgi:signal transduction histidine kinase